MWKESEGEGSPARDVHIFLPEKLVEKIDEYVREGLYRSRSEMINESIRLRIESLERKERGTEPNMPPLAPSARASNHEVIAR